MKLGPPIYNIPDRVELSFLVVSLNAMEMARSTVDVNLYNFVYSSPTFLTQTMTLYYMPTVTL